MEENARCIVLLEDSLQVLKRLDIDSLCIVAISLLGIFSENLCPHKNLFANVLAALFIIVQK
jgi:hypothetical protein